MPILSGQIRKALTEVNEKAVDKARDRKPLEAARTVSYTHLDVYQRQVVIWPHGRIESSLSFVFRASGEHDPAIVGMLSVLRDHWQIQGRTAGEA